MSRRSHDRYERDLRRAQRRRDGDVVPSTWGVALVVVLFVAAVVAFVAGLVRGGSSTASSAPRHDSLGPTYTYDGETIRWYVFADPDTGIEYLVNDRGGCCVREKLKEVG